jgi:hypothetical protein
MDAPAFGRLLIGIGAAILLIGALLVIWPRVGFLHWLGRLPGDIVIRRGSVTIVAPIVTSILLSLLLTLILNLIFRR